MKRFRLTPAAKILCFILVVAMIGGGVFTAYKGGLIKNDISSGSEPSKTKTDTTASTAGNDEAMDDSTINLSLDEWIGWKPLLDANQGLSTQPDSIFGKMGIKVNINIINDASESSNALISGDLNAAGYTTNRVAFLSEKFTQAGMKVVMPVYSNYSNGGDGIIANVNFADINTWKNARIGVPEFSEAETLVAWFVQNSDLPQADKEQIMSNLIMFATPDDAAKAFFAGQLDVAATWEPYLSQAEGSTNSTIVFDTKSSSTLIMDGIVFNADWANAHRDIVDKFIDGMLQAEELYSTDYNTIKTVMPMYAAASDDVIAHDCGNAKLASWADNVEILNKTAPMIYSDMCDIWESLGETVNRDMASTLFDSSFVNDISEKYKEVSTVTNKTEITTEQKTAAADYSSMLTKTSTVNFVPDTAKFLDSAEAAATLDDFIKIANTLDGTIIQIEGNINAVDSTDGGQQLSYNRAQTVANYLISQGVDANRIIIIGNGNTKMIGDPNTDEGKTMNRRVDVMFKSVES